MSGKTLNVATAKKEGKTGFVLEGDVAGESIFIATGKDKREGNKLFVVVNGEELAGSKAAKFLNGIGCIDTTGAAFKGNSTAAEQAYIRAKTAVNAR